MCPDLAEKPLRAAFDLLMKEAGDLQHDGDLGFYAHKNINGGRSVGSGFFRLSDEGKKAFNLLWLSACGPFTLTDRSIQEAKSWMGLHS